MKATLFTPQAPGRVQGRAGANLTVQDRARGAFQELLSQKIEQKAEQIEQQNADGTARPRLGRWTAHGRRDPAGSSDHSNGPAGNAVAALQGRDIQMKDGRFSRAELPDGSKGYIRNGFAVGPNGEMKKDGKILMGINGIVYVGGRGPMKAKGPGETAPSKSAAALAPGLAAGRFLKVRLMGETNLFSKQALQLWRDRYQQTEPMDGARGRILKGIFVGSRGELLDARGNLIGRIRPIHPRNPGSAKAMEEIAPVRHKDMKPSFGQTPFCAAGEGPTVGAVGETLDVTALWKQFMMRWIEGSRDPEDGETSDEGEADKQSDKAERERGTKRFVAVQSDQAAGLERGAWRGGVSIGGDRNLMGALRSQEKVMPMPGKDVEAVSEFLKQARIAGMTGPRLTPVQIVEGMASEVPLGAGPSKAFRTGLSSS